MLQDLRYAGRLLFQSKGWTAMVVLSLALGIGANASIFSRINGLMLRKLSVDEPDTLVRLRWTGKNDAVTSSSDYGYANPENGENVRTTFSYAMYQEFRKENQTMSDVFACAPMGNVNVVADGHAEIASAFIASGNYYSVLGVRAAAGRTLSPDDDRPDAPPVAVISNGYWNRRFGNDPKVVGKVVVANNIPVTIAGVLTPEFTGIQSVINQAPEISFPLSLDPQLSPGPPGSIPRTAQATTWWLQIVGRLKPGVAPQQVLANLQGVFENTARAHLGEYLGSLPAEQRAMARNRDRTQVPHLRAGFASRGVYDTDATALRGAAILSVVVVLVLLIVCANVANLLLSRAAARRKEISVRLSMGATRTRLIRQLLTESLLLALMGAVLGTVAAYWGRQLLPGPTAQAPLDWRFFAFVFALALITGVTFGMAPALRATAGNVNAALKENSRTVVGSRAILGKSLLVVQVAISLVLLIGAGLFLRTLQNLYGVDVGFDPRNIVLFQVNPQLNRYDQPKVTALYKQILERLKALPGVRSATLSNVSLLSGGVNGTDIFVQGRAYGPGAANAINRLAIDEHFFEVLGIPLLAGRIFTANDTQNTPNVAIINEAAARKFFPNENPIGKRFGNSVETNAQTEIVGLLRDAKYNSVRDAAPPTMYVPFFQGRAGAASFEVRTASDPATLIGAIREAVRQVDPNLPLMRVSTQAEQIDQRLGQERLFAQAYTLFGGLALAVASIGLFGLMSYNVTCRTNEIGIRMALGAERSHVVSLVMRESLILVAIGVFIGLTAAFGGGRFIASLLFGLSPADVSSIAVATAILIVVSAVAGYLPARRASRVNPLVALHHE